MAPEVDVYKRQADMSLNTTADMAGKTLTLYVYDVDSNQQTLYDINTCLLYTSRCV